MSLDITALRLLKYRERYEKLGRSVPKAALQPLTATLLEDFGKYFKEFPDAARIEQGPFLMWFKGFRHPNLQEAELTVYSAIIGKSMDDVDASLESGLMARLVAAKSAADLTTLLERWNAGDEVDLYATTRGIVESYEQQVDRKVKNPQVLDPIEDLLKAEENDVGLHWPLACLNRHIKPLQSGDSIVIAMRPDAGKTTFCTQVVTHMAPQVDQLYPGEGRSILWFNNEGPGRKIVMRAFQSALNATVEDLVKLSNQPASAGNEHYKTMVRQKYAEALGGRPGVLRIFDVHGMSSHEVEDLMRLYKPALVVFDMIDNIKFGEALSNNGSRTDQILEAMYAWARMMGVKHDCATLATSQLSADAQGVAFPTLPQLKDSKTGKQGACDVIITIGKLDDPMLENSRYIGTTKNKKVKTGQASSPRAEVVFDGQRGRYVEVVA